jgi:methionyl-tRNA synthetase
LANGLGNLVSRVTALIETKLDGQISFTPVDGNNADSRAIDQLITEFRFHEALSKIWEWVAWGNKTVDEHKLWELSKDDSTKFTATAQLLLASIHEIATKLQPFIPTTAKKILDHLAQDRITKIDPLFPRIES